MVGKLVKLPNQNPLHNPGIQRITVKFLLALLEQASRIGHKIVARIDGQAVRLLDMKGLNAPTSIRFINDVVMNERSQMQDLNGCRNIAFGLGDALWAQLGHSQTEAGPQVLAWGIHIGQDFLSDIRDFKLEL